MALLLSNLCDSTNSDCFLHSVLFSSFFCDVIEELCEGMDIKMFLAHPTNHFSTALTNTLTFFFANVINFMKLFSNLRYAKTFSIRLGFFSFFIIHTRENIFHFELFKNKKIEINWQIQKFAKKKLTFGVKRAENSMTCLENFLWEFFKDLKTCWIFCG